MIPILVEVLLALFGVWEVGIVVRGINVRILAVVLSAAAFACWTAITPFFTHGVRRG